MDPTPSTDPPVEGVPTVKQLLRWSEALSGIARTGLGFTESLYEQERFDEVLHVAADIQRPSTATRAPTTWAGSSTTGCPVGKGVPGYVTPKVAGGRGGQRPGGDPAGPAGRLRHLAVPDRLGRRRLLGGRGRGQGGPEETGIEVEVVRLIAVLDGLRVGMSRIPLYSLVFQCRPVGRQLTAHPARVRRRRGGSPSTPSRSPWPGPSGGATTCSRPCGATPSRSSTTRCAPPSGGVIPTRSEPGTCGFSGSRGRSRHRGYTRHP